MAQSPRNENFGPTIQGVSTLSDTTPINIKVNPATGAVLVEATISAGDIEIGAVELKNGSDDTRATIGSDGVNNALFTQKSKYNVKITVSGNYTYIAKAPLGTAQSSAAWQALRMDSTAGLIVLYADANANFDNVATDLTLLTYS